jgi:[ribosomal protein S18]-alanine N-acetyltransferase
VALYEGLGFHRAGLRKAYYDRGANGRADALLMRLDLTSGAL